MLSHSPSLPNVAVSTPLSGLSDISKSVANRQRQSSDAELQGLTTTELFAGGLLRGSRSRRR